MSTITAKPKLTSSEKFAFEPHTLLDLARILNAPDPSDDARIRDALGFSTSQGQHAASKRIEPERRLMVAVLKDAIDIVLEDAARRSHVSGWYQRSTKRRDVIEARSWIFDPIRDLTHVECGCIDCTSDASWIFAFDNVCAVLGLDASYVRRRLKLSIRMARYYAHRDANKMSKSCESNKSIVESAIP